MGVNICESNLIRISILPRTPPTRLFIADSTYAIEGSSVEFQISSPEVRRGQPEKLICPAALLYTEAYSWYMLAVVGKDEQLSSSFRINLQGHPESFVMDFYIHSVNGLVKTNLPPELRQL